MEGPPALIIYNFYLGIHFLLSKLANETGSEGNQKKCSINVVALETPILSCTAERIFHESLTIIN